MPPTIEPPPVETTPEPQRPVAPSLDDFDQHFNDLETPTPAPAPTPEPTPKETPPKDPTTGKFTKATPAPEPKPAEKPAEPKPDKPTAPQGGEFDPPNVATGTQLRKWAQSMGQRAQKADGELKALRAEITKLKTQPPANGDLSQTVAELAAAKKRLEEYEGELKVTRYERSHEYRETFEKPYQNAVQTAYAEVRELLVSEPNPDDPENPKERQATNADFDEVYNLPLGPATKLAKQKFGDAAFIVLGHRKSIRDAAKSALAAIEEHKGKAAEYEQAQTAQQKMQEEGRNQMYNQALEALSTKFPQYFGEREGDSEWNDALHKGYQMADLAFSDRQGLTPAQSTILDAQMHHRAAAFGALKMDYDRVKAKLTEYEKAETERKSSSPGKPGSAAVSSDKPAITDSIAGIDSLPE